MKRRAKPTSKNTVLVQTRVTEDVADWILTCAQQDGDSVAGWVRRFIINEKARSEKESK